MPELCNFTRATPKPLTGATPELCNFTQATPTPLTGATPELGNAKERKQQCSGVPKPKDWDSWQQKA